MQEKNYIRKWIEGSLSEDEKNQFEKSEEYNTLKRLSDSLMHFKAPDYDVEKELDLLNSKRIKAGKSVAMNWINPIIRIAAIITIFIGGYFLFIYSSSTSIETLAGQHLEVILPDSSYVTLNALSAIKYSESNWNRERLIHLEGEAFFRVSKGARFDVETSAGTVTVKGTQFNVKQRKDYFEVVCYEGLVQVVSGKEIVKLPFGHMFRIINGIIMKADDYNISSPEWVREYSAFRSIPFEQVIGEFERQYNVKIETKNVDKERLFTGEFTNKDLSLALKSITLPLNLTYDIVENQQIVLIGEME